MANDTPDLAALLQNLMKPAQPNIWQALGQFGREASQAGRMTVGQPAQETLGGALGGFATSLEQSRQQAQANKIRQLQTLSAVSQIQAVDKKQKRDKYFEDNKDDLVGSFKSVMPKLSTKLCKQWPNSEILIVFLIISRISPRRTRPGRLPPGSPR